MSLPHVISSKDFTRAQLETLFTRTKEIKRYFAENYRWTDKGHIAKPLPQELAGRIMVSFFDQPSMRTSLTFEDAMELLGGTVRSYRNMTRESSLAKGESLADTFEMTSGSIGVSVIVLRHPEPHAAQRAAAVSSVPVINAGDGTEHPTQALIDLFTIQEALGSIEDAHIAIVGDIKARTAQSLLRILSPYPNKNVIIASPGELKHNSLTIHSIAPYSDVLYVLRPQIENWYKDIEDPNARQKKIDDDLDEYYRLCTVDNDVLARMPKNSIVLHPRPRGPELPTEVDSDPRVLHKVQGRNGGPVRIALLEMIHSGEWQKLAKQ